MVEKGVIRGRVRGHGAPGLSLHAPRRKLRIIQGAEAKVFDVNLVCASSRIAGEPQRHKKRPYRMISSYY
ncbi:hypothetical protein DTO027B6_5133 [Paecilomyces variotii]|nr:hypothetical protein DTO027B6_5133 [Paecilomyces variotii]